MDFIIPSFNYNLICVKILFFLLLLSYVCSCICVCARTCVMISTFGQEIIRCFYMWKSPNGLTLSCDQTKWTKYTLVLKALLFKKCVFGHSEAILGKTCMSINVWPVDKLWVISAPYNDIYIVPLSWVTSHREYFTDMKATTRLYYWLVFPCIWSCWICRILFAPPLSS